MPVFIRILALAALAAAILLPDAREEWLDTSLHDEHVLSHLLSHLLVPYPTEAMTARPVSRLVNDPRREGAELIA